MSQTDTKCLSDTEYAFRIIIPCVNTLIGILTFIYNDNLLSPDELKNMHIAIASVNVLLMLLSAIADILNNRFTTLSQYNNNIKRQNRISNPEIRSPMALLTPKKPSILKDLIPFSRRLE